MKNFLNIANSIVNIKLLFADANLPEHYRSTDMISGNTSSLSNREDDRYIHFNKNKQIKKQFFKLYSHHVCVLDMVNKLEVTTIFGFQIYQLEHCLAKRMRS